MLNKESIDDETLEDLFANALNTSLSRTLD